MKNLKIVSITQKSLITLPEDYIMISRDDDYFEVWRWLFTRLSRAQILIRKVLAIWVATKI